MPADLSIIVSTCNRGERLRATLASLVAQDPAGPRHEVIVVDNNSTDAAWHARQGELRSRLQFREIFDEHDRILPEPRPRAALFGVPLDLYRAIGSEAAAWLSAFLRRDPCRRFACVCRAWQTVNYIRARARARPVRRVMDLARAK